MSENATHPNPEAAAEGLGHDEVPVGVPLDWPVVDDGGTLLRERGTTLPDVQIGRAERVTP